MIKAGIYIHFPFCTTKCIYCDFYSVAQQENLIPDFVNAITKEIQSCGTDTSDWQFDTVFIGGGTPSLLPPADLEKILEAISRKFDLSEVSELTLEANPGTISLDNLRAYRSIGINRLSIGVQSFNSKNLLFLSRIHSAAEARAALENADKAGFDNFSCDLIYGLPDQTWQQWQEDLVTAMEYAPRHISCYTLTVEPGTGLNDLVQGGEITIPEDDSTASLFLKTGEYLREQGFNRYEISNFAVPGSECRHNLHYWRIEPYLGFGPAAHSFDGVKRSWNSANLSSYIMKLESGQSPVEGTELLTALERVNERIGFGLRMAEGLSIKSIDTDFHKRFRNQLELILNKWGGEINYNDDNLKLTELGYIWSDEIAVELMLENK